MKRVRGAIWSLAMIGLIVLAVWGMAACRRTAVSETPSTDQAQPTKPKPAPVITIRMESESILLGGLDPGVSYLLLARKSEGKGEKVGVLHLLGAFVSSDDGSAAVPLDDSAEILTSLTLSRLEPLGKSELEGNATGNKKLARGRAMPLRLVPCKPKDDCPIPPCPGCLRFIIEGRLSKGDSAEGISPTDGR